MLEGGDPDLQLQLEAVQADITQIREQHRQHAEEAGSSYDNILDALKIQMYVLDGKLKFFDKNLSLAGNVIKEDILEILVPDTFRMLNTPPIGDNVRENNKDYFQKYKEMWQQMHSRNIGLLIESYQRLEPGRFLIDGESEYAEWAGKMLGDQFSHGKFYGMRHRETHKPHGLVRFVNDDYG